MNRFQNQAAERMTEFRICDSESVQYKLLHQIRTGAMSSRDLDKLQAQCMKELHQLRSELDSLLEELREMVRQSGRYPKKERSVA
ncbi:hypothetical protein [Paenibacillus whitsoniae]|uniref:Uncharacterized protein n=1 Tax=Paenibacillus whitsoniae TaxID=2496558 RepID=A0A3S0A0A8_9BACL|nr:hypothetical protein [Paenibacillus whitsoniae]RTE03973.1 hypothetical protein EJQ19_27305 [Paenibacillus whitsoniae]